MEHGYDKDSLTKRLHRIEGQVRGIERMVDEDRYCIDILTQVGAVKTALESMASRSSRTTFPTASRTRSPQETRRTQPRRAPSCSQRSSASPRRGN